MTNTIDLTIAICAIRPPEEFLLKTLDEISLCNKKGLNYEILVYGPKHVQIPHSENPKYYTEHFPHGNIYGYNMLCSLSSGRNIAFLTDDMIIPPNLFDVVEFLDSNNEKFNIAGFQMQDGQDYSPFPSKLILEDLGFYHHSVEYIVNSVQNRYGHDYARSPIPLIRFIAASKATIDIMMGGYLFHPAFKNGGGDQFLSIWAWYYGQKLWEKIPVKLTPRDNSPSVLDNLKMDGETIRDLVIRLSLGYTKYV